jgi:hypothetical protein
MAAKLHKEFSMSTMYIESEYDMDQALAETMKLVRLKNCTLNVGFNNMAMVGIFLDNLKEQLIENKIEPGEKDFHLNIMVKSNEQA